MAETRVEGSRAFETFALLGLRGFTVRVLEFRRPSSL